VQLLCAGPTEKAFIVVIGQKRDEVEDAGATRGCWSRQTRWRLDDDACGEVEEMRR
jgi:hypothetical protein